MNKKNIIDTISENLNLTKADVTQVVDEVFVLIEKSLIEKEEISIPSFGKFVPVEKDEQVKRNPRTGENITIAAKTVVKFRPAKQLKENIM